jgi:hypothetical protein
MEVACAAAEGTTGGAGVAVTAMATAVPDKSAPICGPETAADESRPAAVHASDCENKSHAELMIALASAVTAGVTEASAGAAGLAVTVAAGVAGAVVCVVEATSVAAGCGRHSAALPKAAWAAAAVG